MATLTAAVPAYNKVDEIPIPYSKREGHSNFGPWGIVGQATGLVSGAAGINLFTLRVTFNHLASFFYETPIRQGLFGRPIPNPPLETNLRWMGLSAK
jgi:hypothetical protein